MVKRTEFTGLFSLGRHLRSHFLWVEIHQPIVNPVSEAIIKGVRGSRLPLLPIMLQSPQLSQVPNVHPLAKLRGLKTFVECIFFKGSWHYVVL